MNLLWLSIGLFFIGLIEYTIDQYQRLLLSRLKFWSTLAFQLALKLLEFAVNIYAFGTIIAFWERFKNGNHDFRLLFPYFLYVLGTVGGTATALIIYTRIKKRKDHERTLKLISKTDKKGKKRSKKKYNKMVNDAVTKMSAETLLDPVETEDLKSEIRERAIEAATQQISEKINEAFPKEENK